MANIFKIKRTKTAGTKPTTTQLQEGELALNLPDKKIFTNDGTNIIQLNEKNEYASDDEVLAGTVTDKVISPKGLQSRIIGDHITKTVGTGKDFNTLQDAVDWLHNLISGTRANVTLILDPGDHKLTKTVKHPTYNQNSSNALISLKNVDLTIKNAAADPDDCTPTSIGPDASVPFGVTYIALSHCIFDLTGFTFKGRARPSTAKWDEETGLVTYYCYSESFNVDFDSLDTGAEFYNTKILYELPGNFSRDVIVKDVRNTVFTINNDSEITLSAASKYKFDVTNTGTTKPRLVSFTNSANVILILSDLPSLVKTPANVLCLLGHVESISEYYDSTKHFYSVGDNCMVRNIWKPRYRSAVSSGLNTPSGTPANDADNPVRLNSTGKIDNGFFDIDGGTF